ncbi:MAG: helix-turn-helix domain-containing protein [Actinomycetota bacterium]|nr:helix-turn-helix domain-containing protein [Actinomycetota bacterium]
MEHGRKGRRARRSSSHYTVDDLAERSQLTARTIRSYQTQGLLPPPDRHGRVAYYDESHLDRLEEITELKEEGLSLASIQDLIARKEAAAATRAKASKAKARADARGTSEPLGSTPGGSGGVAAQAPLARYGVGSSGLGRGTGMTRLSTLGSAAAAAKSHESAGAPGAPGAEVTDKDPGPPRRRLGLLASVIVALLLTVAAVSSVVAVFSLSDAAEERKRLGRQVSDLQSDLSRLDGNQGPPATVVVPGPAQQVPAPQTPPTTDPPATRTVVVPGPRQPAPAPAAPPAAPPPTAPPTTAPCTLSILGRCLP